MIQIHPEYKTYKDKIPNILIDEHIGNKSILYYAYNVSSITKSCIIADDIYIIKKDIKGKLPFMSIKTLYLRTKNCKIYLLTDEETTELQTLIAIRSLFLEE